MTFSSFVHGTNLILDPLAKLATVAAVVIAGIWAYHLHVLTGEGEYNPTVKVSASAITYDADRRMLQVTFRSTNAGIVPIELADNALTVTLKQIPPNEPAGIIDMDGRQMLDYTPKKYHYGATTLEQMTGPGNADHLNCWGSPDDPCSRTAGSAHRKMCCPHRLNPQPKPAIENSNLAAR